VGGGVKNDLRLISAENALHPPLIENVRDQRGQDRPISELIQLLLDQE